MIRNYQGHLIPWPHAYYDFIFLDSKVLSILSQIYTTLFLDAPENHIFRLNQDRRS